MTYYIQCFAVFALMVISGFQVISNIHDSSKISSCVNNNLIMITSQQNPTECKISDMIYEPLFMNSVALIIEMLLVAVLLYRRYGTLKRRAVKMAVV